MLLFQFIRFRFHFCNFFLLLLRRRRSSFDSKKISFIILLLLFNENNKKSSLTQMELFANGKKWSKTHLSSIKVEFYFAKLLFDDFIWNKEFLFDSFRLIIFLI